MEAVFVYGSLKRGHPLHDYLRTVEFCGPAVTLNPEWELINLGAFPAMIHGTNRVAGELYMGYDELFEVLDRVEQGYRRIRIPVVDEGEGLISAWVYYIPTHIPQAERRLMVETDLKDRITNIDGVETWDFPNEENIQSE